ncbi:MAG: response regulator [Candidatus Uhrbacteria bacterium]
MKKITILLVEDDAYLSEIYTRHFSRHKWQTKIVKNFSEADKKIKRSLPEVVVADIALEEKVGLNWLKNFRQTEATSKIPVIVMTGLSDRASIKEALQAGVNGYFLKSQTTPHELAEKISILIKPIS